MDSEGVPRHHRNVRRQVDREATPCKAGGVPARYDALTEQVATSGGAQERSESHCLRGAIRHLDGPKIKRMPASTRRPNALERQIEAAPHDRKDSRCSWTARAAVGPGGHA